MRGTFGTGNDEWHTPTQYLELARDALGTIDLDPASSDAAQEMVKAERYFSAEDNAKAVYWYRKAAEQGYTRRSVASQAPELECAAAIRSPR